MAGVKGGRAHLDWLRLISGLTLEKIWHKFLLPTVAGGFSHLLSLFIPRNGDERSLERTLLPRSICSIHQFLLSPLL
jgi:hypothetical protein